MMFFAGLVIFNVFLCVQCHDLTKVRWLKSYQRNVTEACTHLGLHLVLSDNGIMTEPIYEADEWFEVPGGKCPKKWQKKWSDVKLAVDHYADLNYWFKWPGSMLHIEFEENLRKASKLWCYDLPLNALEAGFNFIMDEFVGPDESGEYYDMDYETGCMGPVKYHLKNGELRIMNSITY